VKYEHAENNDQNNRTQDNTQTIAIITPIKSVKQSSSHTPRGLLAKAKHPERENTSVD